MRTSTCRHLCPLLLGLLAGPGGVMADEARPAERAGPPPAVTVQAAQAAGAGAPATPPARTAADAYPQVTVIEDDGARIEETRLRGLAQRIVVQSKLPGAPAYEIHVAPVGRDPTQERGSTGRRAWSVWRF